MKIITNINKDWQFYMDGKDVENVNVPHTWNGIDGQNGCAPSPQFPDAAPYFRTTCLYKKSLKIADKQETGKYYLQFNGVNSECVVTVNGTEVGKHEGGYSTFYIDITAVIKEENSIEVSVCNEPNDTVYPQRADFTFYGGIYRDAFLVYVPDNHFDFGDFAGPCVKVASTVEGTVGKFTATAKIVGEGTATVSLYDGKKVVAKGVLGEEISVADVHLWNGKFDPFMYKVVAELKVGGKVADKAEAHIGFRTFECDPNRGFILNGKEYPLRGVCRHQDRPKIGNALTTKEHDEDMEIIMDLGANTIRLAHYQHDQYFYDLCDKNGLVIWAEIPYISHHLPTAHANAKSQMSELISQNYNHPSIVCWGISNEITMCKTDKEDMINFHKEMNDLCHALDSSRLTVVAAFMPALIRNKTLHISDIVSYNLYFGWYAPFWIPVYGSTGKKLDRWHRKYPNTPIGMSEYGAEAMTNLHSQKPKRNDNTEDYQSIYHEEMLRVINARPYIWATHVWNMFDFAADARNQGGEPGMNHKGLVTFDRKIKKDAFYAYKAFWADEKFVHLGGSRFKKRSGKKTSIKVYTNCNSVTLFQNGVEVAKGTGQKIYEFKITMQETNEIEVKTCCGQTDKIDFIKVAKPDPEYIEVKIKGASSHSWQNTDGKSKKSDKEEA